MRTVRTVAEVRSELGTDRSAGRRIGLVPTMGAFHAGHLALIRAARAASDVLVVSLFVNPSQFDDARDLERYPRDEAADATLAEREGVDLLFAPPADQLYPPGFDTWVEPGALGDVLEGAARPGHFRGVATVCTKLFTIVAPDAQLPKKLRYRPTIDSTTDSSTASTSKCRKRRVSMSAVAAGVTSMATTRMMPTTWIETAMASETSTSRPYSSRVTG